MNTSSFNKAALQIELNATSGPYPDTKILVSELGGIFWMPKSGNLYMMDAMCAEYANGGYTKNNTEFEKPFTRAEFQRIIDKLA